MEIGAEVGKTTIDGMETAEAIIHLIFFSTRVSAR